MFFLVVEFEFQDGTMKDNQLIKTSSIFLGQKNSLMCDQ